MWFDDVNVNWDSPDDSLPVALLDAAAQVVIQALPFAVFWFLNFPR